MSIVINEEYSFGVWEQAKDLSVLYLGNDIKALENGGTLDKRFEIAGM